MGSRDNLQPLCAWIVFVRPFVVIDDKGREIVIKAIDVIHVRVCLFLYLETYTAPVVII